MKLRSRVANVGSARSRRVVLAHAMTIDARVRSMRSSAAAGSGFAWHARVAPLWIADARFCSPPTQKNGWPTNAQPPGGATPGVSTDVFRKTAPWVWTTALGSLAEPDVKMTTISSAGTTSRSTASSSASDTTSVALSSVARAVAQGRWHAPSTATVRRYGTSGRNSLGYRHSDNPGTARSRNSV